MDISIIIVSWNVKDLLRQCLSSIFKYMAEESLQYEVFVVDNHSSDGSADVVASEFPEVTLIRNEKNLGFATANNQAMEKATGRYVLLLNPDTELIEPGMAQAVRKMDESPKVGVLGCRLLHGDKSQQLSVRGFPTLASQLLILLKFQHIYRYARPLRDYFRFDFDYGKEQDVDQVMGAFFLIRRELLREIGPLDGKFWIWFEEVDFCKRAHDMGWRVIYWPGYEILHHESKSFAKVLTAYKQKEFNKSLLRYFKKHKPLWQRIVLWPVAWVALFMSILIQIFIKPR